MASKFSSGTGVEAQMNPSVPNVKIETKTALGKKNKLPPLKFLQAQSHQLDL